MRGWKVLAATPLLLVPLAVLGISVADGPEQKASTPAMVLPAAAAEGPTVTMRREKVPADDAGRKPEPGPSEPQDEHQNRPDNRPQSSPTSNPQQTSPPPDQDCADHEHDDDDDDDGVEFVHPCPGAVGDDEDDDDDDGDD